MKSTEVFHVFDEKISKIVVDTIGKNVDMAWMTVPCSLNISTERKESTWSYQYKAFHAIIDMEKGIRVIAAINPAIEKEFQKKSSKEYQENSPYK